MDTSILQTVYENLTSWSFGFLAGFGACTLVCRVVLRHKDHVKEAAVDRECQDYRKREESQ